MKVNNKKVFYLKETSDKEEIDLAKAKRISNAQFLKLMKANKKTSKTKQGKKVA